MKHGQHLPFAAIIDLTEGRLPTADLPARNHLASCERCAAELRSAATLRDLMRTDIGEDAAPALVARAVRLFQNRQVQPARDLCLVRRSIAA